MVCFRFKASPMHLSLKSAVMHSKSNAWKASMLHLVDKQTFNAPIEFSVTGKSWYVRNPETETGYVEEVGTAWGSICLPFDVEKSTLSEGIHQYGPSTGADLGVQKNITFFYGTPAEGTAVICL